MEIIVLGIDHALQSQDPRLKTLISELVEHEGVTAIAEENRCFSNTLGRQVSESINLPWIQIDMSTEDSDKSRHRRKTGEPNATSRLRCERRPYPSGPLCPSRGRD